MALTQYCELDEVRAALGVNDVELPDTVLNLPIYEIGLVRELAKISASLPAAFSDLLDLAESAWSDQQAELFSATRMFSVYACAKQVGVALASMTPKGVSDGKASVARFSDSPYKDVLERIEGVLAGARVHLIETYASFTGSSTGTQMVLPIAFRAGGRTYDPVSG
jgi:hypothetical protein